MHSKASKGKEKSKAIWIPKFLLKDLNIENNSKLAFKLPKASTPSSSKNIPKKLPKTSTPSPSKILLLPHTSKPEAISSMITPSFHNPSSCVSMLILPTFSPTLMQYFQAYTYLLSILLLSFQSIKPCPPYTLSTISFPSPY